MGKKGIPILILFSLVLLMEAGCVSNKKHQKLQSDFQELQRGYDGAMQQLDEKDSQISDLQKQLEEQIIVSEREIALVKKTNEELLANLKKEISSGKIEIEQVRDKLSMRIAEELFFESGKAGIKPEGKVVLRKIGSILKKIPEKNIRVEGHTDNVRIGPSLRAVYPTNWELGSTRAVNVVRFLQEEVKIDPLRLSAVSYGQYRPRASNRTEAGKSKNRRIEIILVDRDLDLVKKMRENLPAQ